MFSFHKSDASRSRQSSVDSQATGSTTFIATSDLWTDQCSRSSSRVAMHSPEQQPRVYPARRSSVFNLRSRSNTGNSMTPSLLSLGHSDMAEHEPSWNGSPPRTRQVGSQNQKEAAGSRRSLFRGKRGKRLSETMATGVGVVDETDAGEKRNSILRKGKKANHQSEDSGSSFIGRISSPFDFQHLSHTDRHEFVALEQASGDKLAPGVLAMRATSAPSHGTTNSQADNIYFNNFSSESLANRSTSALSQRSPPCSPKTRQDSPNATLQPTLRLARSVESFSQPGVSPRKPQQTQPLVSPPRTSSLQLGPAFDAPAIVQEDWESNSRRSSRSKRESGIWDAFAPYAVTTPELFPVMQEGSSYFGHALTTPDDSAIHAVTPPFSPSLADVAEEPERFASPRPAPQPPLATPTSPLSPRSGYFPPQTQRSSVATRSRGRGLSHTSPATETSTSRPSSQASDTLGSFNVTRKMSSRRPTVNRRQSNTWRAIEESWEEDVDYIYDNALEADCEHEWDQSFDDDIEQTQSQDATPFAQFRSSLLVPSANNVPELMPTSAVSTSTASAGLRTPLDNLNVNRFSRDVGFVFSPSLLVPPEYKDAHEFSYEDLLDEYAGSDRHFPLIDASQSTTSSARSSRVRLSRRSSYDSSVMSSTQGSGLWSFPIRRSASSAGSVPELVPSRRNRKEDEMAQNEHSIETELRVSLDSARRGSHQHNNVEELKMPLSRQGSDRSARDPARQHKPALSDSAAKLLSTSTKEDHTMKRTRATTVTQPRSPMLSLFPSPPRHSPTPTRA